MFRFFSLLILIISSQTFGADTKLLVGFDCSPKNLKVEKVSDTHFKIKFPRGGRDKVGYFLYKLENVKDKKITVELVNIPGSKWHSLNPTYCYTKDLSDPKNYITTESKGKRSKGTNGPILPDTSGDQWHFIPNVKKAGKNLILTHKFTGNDVYVGMRPPYTPEYLERYLKTIKHKDFRIYKVGKSKEGLNLNVIHIGTLDKKPCTLLYAREHPDEHDSSWPLQGVIEYLLSDDPDAIKIRLRTDFLIIPILDPDGAIHSKYDRITHNFRKEQDKIPEINRWSKFFYKWVNSGRKIHIIYNIHNVESGEGPHMWCAKHDCSGKNADLYKKVSHSLHNKVINSAKKHGLDIRQKSPTGFTVYRLGSHLKKVYGALHLSYEVNSQAPSRHLSLFQLKNIGQIIVKNTDNFLHSKDSIILKNQISHLFKIRQANFERYASPMPKFDIIWFERKLFAMPDLEKQWRESDDYPVDFEFLKTKKLGE